MNGDAYPDSEKEREAKLTKLIEDLVEERERLGKVMFELEGEPDLSAALARIDTRLASFQADVHIELQGLRKLND